MAPAVLLFHDFRFLTMKEGKNGDKDTLAASQAEKEFPLCYFFYS
jgi:hypothetical protein